MATPNSQKELVSVVVVMTPAPGKMDELEKICHEGAEHHKTLPECLSWRASKTIDLENFEKGWTDSAVEGELVIVQEWTSLNALLENGKSDWATEGREKIGPLMAGPPIMKIAKVLSEMRK